MQFCSLAGSRVSDAALGRWNAMDRPDGPRLGRKRVHQVMQTARWQIEFNRNRDGHLVLIFLGSNMSDFDHASEIRIGGG
jgi:hypothetical protein